MKKFAAMMMALVMMLVAFSAFAEAVTPSVTVADVIVPAGVVVEEDFVVALNALQPETVEQKIFEEIAVFVEEKPVVEFFSEEAVVAVAEYLPAEVEASTLVMDEFFVIDVENYQSEYGDVEAVFEFVTEYKEDDVLVAMVGILPADGAEGDIIWMPLKAQVVEGKVSIAFTQEVLEIVEANSNRVVLSLLRAE